MQTIEAVPVQTRSMIEAEYREMPGLSLTKLQMQRFWGLDEATCNLVVDELERDRFLRRTPTNAYVIGLRDRY